MRLLNTISLGLSLLSCTLGAPVPRSTISLTNSDFSNIAVGSPFAIGWTAASGSVTLTFLNGPAEDVKPVFTIASGIADDSYTWTPPSSLEPGMYAFRINDESGAINYSSRFWIPGVDGGVYLREDSMPAHNLNRPISHWSDTFTRSITAAFRRSTVSFTTSNVPDMKAGESFTIGWTNANGAVKLTLLTGPGENVKRLEVIASDLKGTSYTWNAPVNLKEGTYAFQINDESGGINYSARFFVAGGDN